jgi:soluble lytic murein transglycosylase
LLGAILLGCACALAAPAQSLQTLAATYRKTPNARTRAAMLRFEELHRSDKNGALALLVLGSTEIEQRQFGDALQHLKAAQKRLPQLADYVGYLTATAESELRTFPEMEKTLEPVWSSSPASPLVGKSVVLAANAYLEGGQPAKAVALVDQHLADLAEPQAELLLARGYEALGNASAAATHYQKIYVEYPLAKEASDAETALARYPALSPQALLARGIKLLDRGDYTRAAKQLSTVAPQLTGVDLDLARVRIGVARYSARDYKPAYEQLSSFQASAPESEAERLFYLMECARHLDRIDEMSATLDKLSASYPSSHWRREALFAAASYYSAHNQDEAAEPLYRACSDSFSSDPQSAPCQWKLTWAEYLRNPTAAETMFQEHLKRYSDSDHISTTLYFLGRIAESKSDWGAARVYYEEINNSYPNYYYAMLARDRLQSAPLASASNSAATSQFVSTIHLPKRRTENFAASAVTQQRIDRAHLLASASLDDLAEGELRFGAKTDGQSHIMALELAGLASQRESPDEGIRYIKRFAPNYLALPLDTAPEKFWRLAFPLPYRDKLEEYCRSLSLDPFLVAALIRQESEFNPKAVSRASARGLTQVLPSTGKQLSRKLGIPGYRTNMLFSPDTNLKIGTYYLRALSDQLEGKWEATLASYNAGKSRVLGWLGTGSYHEPAEFVESIPFNETRVYVQSVLRNAEVYRRLYGPKTQ